MNREAPRILVTASPWALPRFIPGVFEELAAAGAELVFAAEPGKDPVPEPVRGRARVRVAPLPLARGDDAAEVTLFRRLSDFARFLDPDLEAASWPRRRTALRALVRAGSQDAEAVAAELAHVTLPGEVHAGLSDVLAGVERLLPPQPELVDAVAALDLDGILLVSRCSLGGTERDVLKTGRVLGIPTVMLVWSWDNLSSKALLNEHPDHLLVWNELQVREAVELHGVEPERVHAVGAPNFDPFFAALAALHDEPRAPGPKTILYLGSSKNITRREPELFDRWLAAVRASADPAVAGARVVVRPYPGGGPWSRWDPPPTSDFSVERGRKLEPERLARLMHDADAVVALNTSAELEAAIAEKPVVTVRAGEYAPGQEGSVHFQYLLAENGGFVIDARDLDEHVRNLSRVLAGDYDARAQREFVERFLRPNGLGSPVAPHVAAAVLQLAAERVPAATRT